MHYRHSEFILPRALRRLIVTLRAELPPLRINEIETICYVRTGRRPNGKTIKRIRLIATGRTVGIARRREVLGPSHGRMYQPEDLHRTFFTTRFRRQFDAFGYIRFWQWRIYGEHGRARRGAIVWLYGETLTGSSKATALANYRVSYQPDLKLWRTVDERIFASFASVAWSNVLAGTLGTRWTYYRLPHAADSRDRTLLTMVRESSFARNAAADNQRASLAGMPQAGEQVPAQHNGLDNRHRQRRDPQSDAADCSVE